MAWEYQMKKMIGVLLFSSFLSFASQEVVVLNNAAVSCIRVVENGNDYQDTDPELFFWDEKVANEASKLFKAGFELSRHISSDVLCGGYTPIIKVNSRNRQAIKKSINSYRPIIEDGVKVWVDDIKFKKQ